MNMRKRFRVKPGEKVRLGKIATDDDAGFKNREAGEAALAKDLERLSALQYLLYAENRRALLIILQAMDAGGKDGTIRRVMSGLNPQGCRVVPFKAPTPEELDHEFLWRIHRQVPPRGEFGIFNRSHYEDVVVVRVHDLVPEDVWSKRYEQINDFERILAANDTVVVKFFLHISKDEQKKRLEERIADPTKQWKLNPADFEERKRWDEYMEAYGDAISRCSTKWAPWYVIPADRKWARNAAVARILADTLEDLGMKYPKPPFDPSALRVE